MNFLKPFKPQIHALVRIAFGIMFMTNGGRKLFGWFGGEGTIENVFTMYGAAGVIEFFGGILVFLGLFTPIVAFILAGEMFFAYLLGHVTGEEGSLWWWANNGERAAMYAWYFLLLSATGAGIWSLDEMMGRNSD